MEILRHWADRVGRVRKREKQAADLLRNEMERILNRKEEYDAEREPMSRVRGPSVGKVEKYKDVSSL